MRKIGFLTVVFLAFFQFAYSQEDIIKFARTGTPAQEIHSLSDTLGNLYIAGKFDGSFNYGGLGVTGPIVSENGNIFILKTNSAGKPIWLHSITGITADDNIFYEKYCINSKGELAILFRVENTHTIKIANRLFALDTAMKYIGVAKFSPQGFLMWVQNTPITFSSDISGRDIEMDKSGNVYIAGSFNGSDFTFGNHTVPLNPRGSSFFLTKFNSLGEIIWASTCGYSADTVGSIDATDISVDNQEGIFITGTTNQRQSFLFGSSQIKCQGNINSFVAYFNAQGNAQWAIPYEGVMYVNPDKIITDAEGNAIFSCYYQSVNLMVNGTNYYSSVAYNLLVSKIRPNGTFHWVKEIFTNLDFGPKSEIGFNEGQDVVIACQGKFLSQANLIFASFDRNTGNQNWSLSSYSPDGTGFGATVIDRKGNIFSKVYVTDSFALDNQSVSAINSNFVESFIKIDNNGDLVRIFEHPNSSSVNAVTFNDFGIDAFGNLYIIGMFDGSGSMLGKFSLNDQDLSSGIFVAKYGPVTTLSGNIMDTYGNSIGSGMVRLIGYTVYQKSPMIDSVLVNTDGSFIFQDVPFCNYILKYEPALSEIQNYMPVYYPAVGRWVDAVKIIINQTAPVSSIIITVPPREVFTGNASLTGAVNSIDSGDVFKSVKGKAQPKARATLARGRPKSDYEIINYTETDANGNFLFTSVDDGEYIIFIEIPGLPVINPHEVVVSGGIFISNLNYFIDEDFIEGYGSPVLTHDEAPGENTVRVFPNPSSGTIQIDIPTEKSIDHIILMDAVGRELASYDNISNQMIITDLTPGLYFLQFLSDNKQYSKKIIVKP